MISKIKILLIILRTTNVKRQNCTGEKGKSMGTRMIRGEIRRAVISFRMLAAYIISLLALMIGGWDYLSGFSTNGTYLEKYLISLAYGTGSWLAILFPIVACIPYALSYREEADSGFYYLYVLKTGREAYRAAKIISVFLSGFAAVFGACLTWYLYVTLVIGTGDTTFPILYDLHFAEKLYVAHPFIYGMIYTFNAGFQGGIFAILGLGVSAVVKNKYIAILIPFAYCIFSASVLELWNQALNAITLFVIGQYYGGVAGYWGILFYDSILILVGIGLYRIGEHRLMAD